VASSSRPLPKSPRSKSRTALDSGSAVVEFALLALPLCIMTISATNYAINVYSDTLLRAGAIATARFTSLADTSLDEAKAFARRLCLSQSMAVQASCLVEITTDARPVAVAQFSYQRLSLLVYQPGEVTIRVSTALETPKR
jgi:Flp pilus assembly protein TadG